MSQSTEPHLSATLNRALSPQSGGSEASYNERFPSFDDLNRNKFPSAVADSPLEENVGQSIVPEYKWPARRGSQSYRNGRISGHKPRRSVSNALNNFRARRGSVSENAQELAEALKAPVSYKLIVRLELIVLF
jgi:solute carrier family 35, member E1